MKALPDRRALGEARLISPPETLARPRRPTTACRWRTETHVVNSRGAGGGVAAGPKWKNE